MDQVIQDSAKIIATLGNLFEREGAIREFDIISKSECVIEVTGYDNWDGGADVYGIFCKVPLNTYSYYEQEIKLIEESIREKAESIFRTYPQCWIGEVVVSPQLTSEIKGKIYQIPNSDLLEALELQKNIMVSVSTGGQKIQLVNQSYQKRLLLIDSGLKERNIVNPNPYKDLWEWYGKWSAGEMPTYQSRREFLSEMFASVIEAVDTSQDKPINPVFEDPTGWTRVDRSIGEIKLRVAQANSEEQYQAVGLLCRETLISVAQAVYDGENHPTLDGKNPSKTDAKRMLEAFIAHELPGKSNESLRRHAKSSLALANDLTHKRTAEFRISALCAEATNAVVNIASIISGRRDPR